MQHRRFASVRTQYMKSSNAVALLDHVHALRQGATRSPNVQPEYIHNNVGLYAYGCTDGISAFERACERYKTVTGKKIRSDFNALFEHVVVLSESQYSLIEEKIGQEKTRIRVLNGLKRYAKSIKIEFGFEPLSIDLHLDEGHYDLSGKFIRNVHAHITFFNYDFQKKVAPLRHLMVKGKNDSGRTLKLNPNFEKMQDLVSDSFRNLGFIRGESKSITNINHCRKEIFVKEKLNNLTILSGELELKSRNLKQEIKISEKKKDSLESEIADCKMEISKWLCEIDKLKSYASELTELIKRKALCAINKFRLDLSLSKGMRYKK
ncbi:plasmid recombination protein [Shewanella sp. SM101]|uniref:plasmid recombination protein n=1 Tax=Shewanella sp. SM101 TaxID=2912789 RepID=UPI0021D83220|nr:plasmid recombination protein [Shewanella sp. SM101]MCU8103993.1 plasmid recombination protein [Shewanella sp. SM101]